MMRNIRNIENSGIVKTVYSDISRRIQGHSLTFSHVRGHAGALRYIEAYPGIIEPY